MYLQLALNFCALPWPYTHFDNKFYKQQLYTKVSYIMVYISITYDKFWMHYDVLIYFILLRRVHTNSVAMRIQFAFLLMRMWLRSHWYYSEANSLSYAQLTGRAHCRVTWSWFIQATVNEVSCGCTSVRVAQVYVTVGTGTELNPLTNRLFIWRSRFVHKL